MIEPIRSIFNDDFSDSKYADVLSQINDAFNHRIPFRVAESPIFIDNDLKQKLISASEIIVDFVLSDDSEELTRRAIPDILKLHKNVGEPTCLAIDFAITKDSNNDITCQLIELQAAMSLYGFTEFLASTYQNVYNIPLEYTPFLSGLETESYWEVVKKSLLGTQQPKNVILLEVYPNKQQNQIDFLCLEKALGICTVCVSEIIQEGNNIFYIKDNQKIPAYRIINRVLLEELNNYPALVDKFLFSDSLNIEWVNHPVWFFRISKFIMPFLKGESFPDCVFLDQFNLSSVLLQDYVMKPLFSAGGKGVNLNVTLKSIEAISDKHNYILQRKVDYIPCLLSPDGSVKAEIRMLYLWEKNATRPIPVLTLARFTRGDQMALRYNNQGTWVGASVCFFNK